MTTNHEVTFVAMGPNAWGKGDTIPTAVRNCKEHVGSFAKEQGYRIHVLEVTGPFYGVDGMGYIRAENRPVSVKHIEVKGRPSR